MLPRLSCLEIGLLSPSLLPQPRSVPRASSLPLLGESRLPDCSHVSFFPGIARAFFFSFRMRRNPRSERGTASPSTVGHLLIAMLRQMRPDAERGRPPGWLLEGGPHRVACACRGSTACPPFQLAAAASPAVRPSWGGRCSFRGSFTFRVASLVKSAYQSRDPEIGVCYWPAACFF